MHNPSPGRGAVGGKGGHERQTAVRRDPVRRQRYILDLEGEIDISAATEFKEALLQSIDGGAGRIVVDLTKVTLMDSTGLSVLVSGERRLRPRGGSLAVACDDRIRRVLTMTGLHNAFALCATRDEARRAAFSGRDASGAAPAPDSL